jgi:predicted deacylase
MQDAENANLARLQNAQIIVDSPAPDGTLRWFLSTRNIKGITLEVGDPNRFQKDMIRASLVGIENTLVYLNIRQGAIETPDQDPVICSHSYWQYTDDGGFLQVHPEVTDLVMKGEKVATLRNIFGDILKEYKAKEDGVIIGKSSHPVAQTGSRIIHLGIIA